MQNVQLTKEQIKDKVIDHLVEDYNADKDECQDLSRTLDSDLAMDSLDIAEFTMWAEDEFGIVIFDEEIEHVKNIGQVIDMINIKLNTDTIR